MPPLRALQIESSSRCNLRCRGCYRRSYSEPYQEGELAPELFRKLGHVLSRLRHVDLGGWGEPLLNPHVAEYSRLCREYGCPDVILATHGGLLTRELGRDLLHGGVTALNVSLDAPADESYARSHQGGNLQLVLSNLSQMAETRQQEGSETPEIHASFILSTENLQELVPFVRMAAAAGADRVVVRSRIFFDREEIGSATYGGYFRGLEPDRDGTRAEVETAARTARELGIAFLDVGVERARPTETARCFCRADQTAFIGWQGDVSACCFLGHPLVRLKRDGSAYRPGRLVLGNIGDQALDAIWESEAYVEFRRLHLAGQAEACTDCPARYLYEDRGAFEG